MTKIIEKHWVRGRFGLGSGPGGSFWVRIPVLRDNPIYSKEMVWVGGLQQQEWGLLSKSYKVLWNERKKME